MHKFVDETGQEWKLALSIGLIEEINEGINVDLFEPASEVDGEQVITRISPVSSKNIRRFANLLFMICEDQCKESDIDSKAFGRRLQGSVIKSAYEAFYAEWTDFSLNLGRVDLAEVITKYSEVVKEEMAEIARKIGEITREEIQAQVKLMEQKTGLTPSEIES